MRRLLFDQYEFDSSESEQSLAVAVSAPRRDHDLPQLLAACEASAPGPPPPAGWGRWPRVLQLLRDYAGLDLPPSPAHCRTVLVLADDWDELEVAVAAGPVLVWFRWRTTA